LDMFFNLNILKMALKMSEHLFKNHGTSPFSFNNSEYFTLEH